MADKCGTFLDDDAHGFEIAQKFRVGFQFAAFLDCYIAVYRTVNGDGLGADFAFDDGIFSKSESAFGNDFAIEFAVKNEI